MRTYNHRSLSILLVRVLNYNSHIFQNSVVEAFWKRGARSDGRVFGQARPYTVQHGVLNHAAGSALVKCRSSSFSSTTSATTNTAGSSSSSTVVVAAVTLLVGQPSAAAPRQGDVVVTVTGAVASISRSTENCTNISLLQSFLQRILEENVDLGQLVIAEGKMAYRLAVTISLLEDAGSAADVCLAAAVAALLDTRLPVQPSVEDGVVYADAMSLTEDTKPLRMPIVPCCLTAAGTRFSRQGTEDSVTQHHWMVDPDTDEQCVQDSAVAVVVNAAASADEEILAVHFSASDPAHAIATTELARIMHMAVGHAAYLYPVLQRP